MTKMDETEENFRMTDAEALGRELAQKFLKTSYGYPLYSVLTASATILITCFCDKDIDEEDKREILREILRQSANEK